MRSNPEELDERAQSRIIEAYEALLPRVLPAEWSCFGEKFWNAQWYRSLDGLRVCAAIEDVDGELWIHVSFSRHDRVPSWFDTKRVKELFIGKDRKGIQVLPKSAEYYNHCPNCLHLYACIERDPLPDFRDASGAL